MYIEQLRLIAFGPFTDRTINLRPGLNVLYGPNEAGKSSTLRAVHALLFGFGHKTSDNYLHNYQQLRVGAVIQAADGSRLACVRRKGDNGTLRDGDDLAALDESQLQVMLGHVREPFFSTVFGIDHERLREGGDDIVRGHGEIGELLFAAGGVSHLRDTKLAIDKQARELFKAGKNAREPQINKTLAKLKQLDAEIHALQHSGSEYSKYREEHKAQGKRAQDLAESIQRAETTKKRLERIQSALGLLSSWKDKRAELRQLSDVVMLPDNARERFRQAENGHNTAVRLSKDAADRVQKYTDELTSLVVPADFLAQTERIEKLYQRLGTHREDSDSLVGLVAEQGAAHDDARRALGKLGWKILVDDAHLHRVPDAQKTLVRKLASRQGELVQAVDHQRQTLDALQRERADVLRQLETLRSEGVPANLQAAHAKAIPLVNVEDDLARRRDKAKLLEQSAHLAKGRLTWWHGTIEEACLLKTPSEETVETFAKSLIELDALQTDLNKDSDKYLQDKERVTLDLQELEFAESVPTESELRLRRSVRDVGVALAISKLRGDTVDHEVVNAFVTDVGDGEDLPAAMKKSIETADGIADRLRRESERVAKKARLCAEQEKLERRAKEIASRREHEQSRRDAWTREWLACWEEASITPASPVEMLAWLRQHRKLLELVDDWHTATSALDEDERQISAARENLTCELVRLGASPSSGAALATLEREAAKRIDQAAEEKRDHKRLTEDGQRIDRETGAAQGQLQRAEQELASWQGDWATALASLRLTGDAIPEQVEDVLENLESLFAELDEAERLGKQIRKIKDAAASFSADVEAACQTLAPDLLGKPVDEMASTLYQRLADAKETHRAAKEKRKLIDAETRAAQEAKQAVNKSLASLDALVAEAARNTRDDLPKALDDSDRKRQLSYDVNELEKELARLSAGKPLHVFSEEAEQEEPDKLPSRIRDLDKEIEDLRKQEREATRAMDNAQSELKKYGGESTAAEKSVERQFLLSRLSQDVGTYAVATVASRLLQCAVERYQKKSQGPVVARASAIFAALTCHSFSGLRPDLDTAGHQVLVGTRPDGTTLPVQAMSEGTQDQLYLALRLGTIEHWLAQDEHTPLPMVVDDILLTFDDARAAETLRVLLNLSERTQILFFTHHSHLTDLAQQIATTTGHSLNSIDLTPT